jgi:hypothetical protein
MPLQGSVILHLQRRPKGRFIIHWKLNIVYEDDYNDYKVTEIVSYAGVDWMSETELIESLIKQLQEVPAYDHDKLDALKRRAEMLIRKIFGSSSEYLTDLASIRFTPRVVSRSTGPSDYRDRWISGTNRTLGLFNVMLEELRLSEQSDGLTESRGNPNPLTNKVFVVHGHDQEMKQSVARILERLGLTPIILHEQPNQARTIIEKFVDYSDVSFAVVLFSPDDMGYQREQAPDQAKPRARQNVVFELGFFIGKLGRRHVLSTNRYFLG